MSLQLARHVVYCHRRLFLSHTLSLLLCSLKQHPRFYSRDLTSKRKNHDLDSSIASPHSITEGFTFGSFASNGRQTDSNLHALSSELPPQSRFKNSQEATNFLNSVWTFFGLDKPVFHTTSIHSKKGDSINKVTLRFTLIHDSKDKLDQVLNYIKPGFKDKQCLNWSLEKISSKASDAKSVLRMALANAVYEVLDKPFVFLPGGGNKAATCKENVETWAVPIEFDRALTKQLLSEIHELQVEDSKDTSPGAVNDHFLEHMEEWQEQPVITAVCHPMTIKEPLNLDQDTASLPLATIALDILRSIKHNQVSIITAGTGSGKTTKVPQLLMDYVLEPVNILITQPRRLATISIAQRVAQERSQRIGDQVGYAVRFEQVMPLATRDRKVTFLTAGLLLRWLRDEKEFRARGITHIILDECHERDVDTDLLLMLCRRLVKQMGIKLILMSATMETKHLIQYLSTDGKLTVGEPLTVPQGNPYPIEELYLDDIAEQNRAAKEVSTSTADYFLARLQKDDKDASKEKTMSTKGKQRLPSSDGDNDNNHVMDDFLLSEQDQEIPEQLIVDLIRPLVHQAHTSVLIFLPGWDEIVSLQRTIHLQGWHNTLIYMVHSSVPYQDTEGMFNHWPGCKLILATNVAESSVTIPRVTHVIDTGLQKCTWFDHVSGVERLVMCWASKANMRQRRGRTGRTGPGHYWCLLSRAHVQSLPSQTPPELTRSNLADVCASLIAFKNPHLTRCRELLGDALNPPKSADIDSALNYLVNIGAVTVNPMTGHECLTPLGKACVKFPLTIGLARFLLLASMLGAWDPASTTVSAVSQRPLLPAKLTEEKAELADLFMYSLQYYTNRLEDAESGEKNPEDRYPGHHPGRKTGNHHQQQQRHSHRLELTSSDPNSKRHYYTDSDPLALHAILENQIQSSRLNYSNLAKIQRAKRDLLRYLPPKVPSDNSFLNRNRQDPTLYRFLITWSHYPKLAHPLYSTKRRIFDRHNFVIYPTERDKKPVHARLNHNSSIRASSLDINAPRWLVFQELLDLGLTVVLDATAIDPMHLLILAEDLQQDSQNLEMLVVDQRTGFLFTNREDMKLVLRMRKLWRERMLPLLLETYLVRNDNNSNPFYDHSKQKMLPLNASGTDSTASLLSGLAITDSKYGSTATDLGKIALLQKYEALLIKFLNNCTEHRRKVVYLSNDVNGGSSSERDRSSRRETVDNKKVFLSRQPSIVDEENHFWLDDELEKDLI